MTRIPDVLSGAVKKKGLVLGWWVEFQAQNRPDMSGQIHRSKPLLRDLGDGTAQGSLAILPIGHLRPYTLETQKPVTCDPTSFYYLGHAKLDLVTCDPTHPNKGKHKAHLRPYPHRQVGSQTTATKLEKDNPNSNSPKRDWQAVSSQDWFWPLSMLATINQSVSKILYVGKSCCFSKYAMCTAQMFTSSENIYSSIYSSSA